MHASMILALVLAHNTSLVFFQGSITMMKLWTTSHGIGPRYVKRCVQRSAT